MPRRTWKRVALLAHLFIHDFIVHPSYFLQDAFQILGLPPCNWPGRFHAWSDKKIDAIIGIGTGSMQDDLGLAPADIEMTKEEIENLRREHAEATARYEALRDAARNMLARAHEVWDSIPATHEDDDPMVQRHAKALNALPEVIDALRKAVEE